MNTRGLFIFSPVILVLFLLSCGAPLNQLKLEASGPQKTFIVPVKARSFEFDPSNIVAYKGDTIMFKIESVSGIDHNFTIKNPEGKILKSVDLPPNAKVSVLIDFPQTGKYQFYCDHPFHTFLGMKGVVEVKNR